MDHHAQFSTYTMITTLKLYTCFPSGRVEPHFQIFILKKKTRGHSHGLHIPMTLRISVRVPFNVYRIILYDGKILNATFAIYEVIHDYLVAL